MSLIEKRAPGVLVSVVPIDPTTATDGLRDDCALLTMLVQRNMHDNPLKPPATAYAEVIQMLSPICDFPWEKIALSTPSG